MRAAARSVCRAAARPATAASPPTAPAGQVCTNNNCAACTTDGQCVVRLRRRPPLQRPAPASRATAARRATARRPAPICNTGTMFCGALHRRRASAHRVRRRPHLQRRRLRRRQLPHDARTARSGQVCNLATHTCEGCGSGAATRLRRRRQLRRRTTSARPTPASPATATSPADCNNTAQDLQQLHLRHVQHERGLHRRLRREPRLLGGACVSGNCNSSAECGSNQLCVSHALRACGRARSDAQCVADTSYGAMHICLGTGSNAQCVAGNCHDTSADCTGTGQICGITTAAHLRRLRRLATPPARPTRPTAAATSASASACVPATATTPRPTAPPASSAASRRRTPAATARGRAGDTQCTADTRYGAGNICFQGTARRRQLPRHQQRLQRRQRRPHLRRRTANICGACTERRAVHSPIRSTAATTICNTATGQPNVSKASPAVCTTQQRPAPPTAATSAAAEAARRATAAATPTARQPFGRHACINHTCSDCDAVAGNTYYVDPVNGNDTPRPAAAAGGDATAGLQLQDHHPRDAGHRHRRRAPAPRSSSSARARTPTRPGGRRRPADHGAAEHHAHDDRRADHHHPARRDEPGATRPTRSGFILSNSGAGIAGDPAAPLILDGNGNTVRHRGPVRPGPRTSSISNLTIQNTRGDGISVTAGTLNIGAGVVVTSAGNAAASSDGLTSGRRQSNITNASGTQTLFTEQRRLRHRGAAARVGEHHRHATVPRATATAPSCQLQHAWPASASTRRPARAGLVTNNITGLVAGETQRRDAALRRLEGQGAEQRVRRSGRYGVLVVQTAAATAAAATMSSKIDLGKAGSSGQQLPADADGALGLNTQRRSLRAILGGGHRAAAPVAPRERSMITASRQRRACSSTARRRRGRHQGRATATATATASATRRRHDTVTNVARPCVTSADATGSAGAPDKRACRSPVARSSADLSDARPRAVAAPAGCASRAARRSGATRAGRPVALIIEPDAGPDAILDLVASARASVWMEMYLLTDARAIAALAGPRARPAATCASSSSRRRT